MMNSIPEGSRVLMGLLLLASLSACGGASVQEDAQDINVSPRSQEAYDPAYRELEGDPTDRDEEQN